MWEYFSLENKISAKEFLVLIFVKDDSYFSSHFCEQKLHFAKIREKSLSCQPYRESKILSIDILAGGLYTVYIYIQYI